MIRILLCEKNSKFETKTPNIKKEANKKPNPPKQLTKVSPPPVGWAADGCLMMVTGCLKLPSIAKTPPRGRQFQAIKGLFLILF